MRRRLSTLSQRGVAVVDPRAPAISKEGEDKERDPPDLSDEPTIDLIAQCVDNEKLGKLAFLFNHAMNDRREDEFHRKAHLSSVHNNAGRTAHKGIMNHA